MDTFRERIRQTRIIFDGGMGSSLQAKGLPAGELPERWNVTHPEVLKEIHGAYLDAGCDVLTTNTFGANPFKYPDETSADHPHTLTDVVRAALHVAKEAVREKGHGFVALDLGPTGRLLAPMGDLAFEDCISAYGKVIDIAKEDADLILIETMSDLYELKAAVLAAKEYSTLPVVATVAFDPSGKLLTGGTPKSVVALLEGLRVDALGLNCGLGPGEMAPFAKELLSYASVPVIVQPNAGLPRVEQGVTVYDLGAEDFAAGMRDILSSGARIVGGCCGTTPAHIAALKGVVAETKDDAPAEAFYASATLSGVGHSVEPDGLNSMTPNALCGSHTAALHGTEVPPRPTMQVLPQSAFGTAKTRPQGSSERSVPLSDADDLQVEAGGLSPHTKHVSSCSHRNATLVTGFADAVEIGDDPVIIGERINPTGKKRFQQALREADMEYILNVALSEQEQGAHILDVNVGLPEIDEPEMMTRVVQELQSVTELPLQLDTSDPEALARAMRIYNGKPLINSVSGKREVMDAVFPLVAKYGGVVVCLLLDEDGIPEDADGRIRIAEKIIEEAQKYDIGTKDLLFDALCMTISSEEQGAVITLETVRRLHEELHVRTVLGVSNISFGLPMRDFVNATFYTMALERGLNAGIINPGSEEMMRAFRAFRALRAYDAHCGDYIETYANYAQTHPPVIPPGQAHLPSPATPPLPADACISQSAFGAMEGRPQGSPECPAPLSDADSLNAWTGGPSAETCNAGTGGPPGLSTPLAYAIRKGLKDQAVAAAKEALLTQDALALINEEMMPALDAVGQGFEAGTLFLPQLIMSAEAAKAAFDVIRTQMSETGGETKKKGKVVIATVKGDIHDIGKNIVKVLLENYNFDVIDLGKDVAPERILEAVKTHDAHLVGLSALMTTTVPAMEETIRLLKKEAPGTRVMVGGAVMTKEYANKIGADQYAKDAMGAVDYAEQLLSSSSDVLA